MSDAAPASAESRAATIAKQLRDQILNGKYEAGERLPSERDLVGRTGANRASVREALKQLQQQGMIEIRRGGGARVIPLERSDLGVLQHLLSMDSPDPAIVRQWMDVWRLVLAGTTRLAVERATDPERARAVELIAVLRRASLGDDDFVAAGDELTALISVASRNTVLQMVRNGLVSVFDSRRDLRRKLRPRGRVFGRLMRDIEAGVLAGDAREVSELVHEMVGRYTDMVIEGLATPPAAKS